MPYCIAFCRGTSCCHVYHCVWQCWHPHSISSGSNYLLAVSPTSVTNSCNLTCNLCSQGGKPDHPPGRGAHPQHWSASSPSVAFCLPCQIATIFVSSGCAIIDNAWVLPIAHASGHLCQQLSSCCACERDAFVFLVPFNKFSTCLPSCVRGGIAFH